jgi:hypothetical protein
VDAELGAPFLLFLALLGEMFDVLDDAALLNVEAFGIAPEEDVAVSRRNDGTRAESVSNGRLY